MAGIVTKDFKEGCAHYRRGCRLLAPCCKNPYPCHICHDQEENHLLNRYTITQHICASCLEVQNVGRRCSKCGTEFALYQCLLCYMFDDNMKGQFHCNFCGLCRVGGGENYYHCQKCNMCLAKRLNMNHKCVENCAESDCPVCAEYLYTTTRDLHVPPCGHLIHKHCYEDLLQKNFKDCPVCKEPY